MSGTILGIIASSSAAAGSGGSTYIVLGVASSPFVVAYPWSAGFGTKYADPATLPTSAANAVAFN